MRILHAIRSDGFGGVENLVARLSVAQADAGHEVVIVGGDPLRMRRATMDSPVRIVAAATLLAVRSATARELAHSGLDVVNAHMTAAEVACVAALRRSPVPLISTRHFAQRRGSNAVVRAAVSFSTRRISQQVAVSRYVQQSIEGSSVLIHPGVPDDAEPARWDEREPVVLVAQRLESEKHTEDAILAFAKSGLADRGWRLDLAGEGSRRRALTHLVGRLRLTDHARLLGHRSDVRDLMRRSRILLATCPNEHFGLTVVEAMSAGLPVVATAAGGHLETVGAVSGSSLYEVSDVHAAAGQLADLAADPVAWARYGADLQSAQRRLFTLTKQAEATQRVYERFF